MRHQYVLLSTIVLGAWLYRPPQWRIGAGGGSQTTPQIQPICLRAQWRFEFMALDGSSVYSMLMLVVVRIRSS